MIDRNRRISWIGTLLAAAALLAVNGGQTLADEAAPAATGPAKLADWPQYCGPNRDSVAVNSPKLLDAWPKEGPPLAWKSDAIPGYYQGGCGGPAVAEGKVFVYATSKYPVGGSNLYKLITPDVLANAGWLPNLPADLAKKIEEARVSPKRPRTFERGTYFSWWGTDAKEKDKERAEYLAKKPELDKYIKDFVATLSPDDARNYGDYAKRRICITADSVYGEANGYSYDSLEKLSKLQGAEYATLREWAGHVGQATRQATLGNHFGISGFMSTAWNPSFTRSDTLVCLDAATGKTLWKKDFPLDAEAQVKMKTQGTFLILGLCGTPAVSDGKCYFGGVMGLYCLSVKDGTVIWQVKCPPSHTSALVAGGVVYYCGTAYRGDTGQVLWKTPLWKGKQGDWGGCNTNPSLWKSGGKTYILAGDSANLVCCLDLETGKDIWTVKYAGSCWPDYCAIRTDGDILASEGKVYRMTPTALEPLTTLAETKGGGFSYGPVMYQDHLYQVFSPPEGGKLKVQGLCCWDVKTGEYKWSCDIRSGDLKWDCNGPVKVTGNATLGDYTPSILADGKIIMALGKGYEDYVFGNYGIALIKATPEKFVPLGYFESGLIPWCPMALAAGKLFVRTEMGISCYDLAGK